MQGSTEHDFVGSAGVAQSVEQLIRNEKVGCSIHLSGTNKINDLRVVVAPSAVSCHTQVTVDGTIWQHCITVPSLSSQFLCRHISLTVHKTQHGCHP